MARRRVKNGFWKKHRTRRGGLSKDLLIEAARIIDTAAHGAANQAKPHQSVINGRSIFAERLQSRGDCEARDRTATAQARVAQEIGPRLGHGHLPDAERFFPTGTGEILDRGGFVVPESIAQCSNAPPCRRDGANSSHKNGTHSHLLSARVAFAPPKPKELLSAISRDFRVGALTTGKAQTGSTD